MSGGCFTTILKRVYSFLGLLRGDIVQELRSARNQPAESVFRTHTQKNDQLIKSLTQNQLNITLFDALQLVLNTLFFLLLIRFQLTYIQHRSIVNSLWLLASDLVLGSRMSIAITKLYIFEGALNQCSYSRYITSWFVHNHI